MRDSRQRRMVCTDETPAPLTAGLALARCSTVLFLLVGLFPFWIDWLPDPDLCAPVWLLMLAADLWFGARVWGGQSKRWCIRMDRRGLTEVWRLVGWKHYPWDSVQSVDLRSQSAVVHTWLGDIDIGPEVEGGRALAVLVKLRLDQGVRAEVPTTVDHERVAKWLGVAPGEVVSAKIRDESVDAVTRVGCLTGVPLSVILICLLSGEPQPVFWLFVLACVVGVARAARRCPRRIDATAERLRVHCLLGRYDLAWSDLLSIRHNPQLQRPCWVVRTLRGRFSLHQDTPGAARLAKAIDTAVSARRKGAELPRMSEVSDAAISPVTVSTSPDRGLSPAAGDPPETP